MERQPPLLAAAALLGAAAAAANGVGTGNERRLLLLDKRVVDSAASSGVSLVLGAPTKEPTNPLFCEDRPWEVTWLNTYPDVWIDNGEYKCFWLTCVSCAAHEVVGGCPTSDYRFNPYRPSKTFDRKPIPHGARLEALLFANSTDGRAWTKPALDRVEYNGSTANNIVAPFVGGVLLDEAESDPARRWKMFDGRQVCESRHSPVR